MIKLAILEKDQGYLTRIANVFEKKYSDRLQIYSFTDMEIALSVLKSERIDVLLASEPFYVDITKIPVRCGFAYLVESPDIDKLHNQHTICKFQNVDLIYRQILSIYSEKTSDVADLRFGDASSKVIFFQPVSGGVGASTMAAACAMHFAAKGEPTLYLNLEHLGSADIFFKGSGDFSMSDVIFALKSRSVNLTVKLESYVKCDESGVFFYSQSENSLHMMEINYDEIGKLISELRVSGSYKYVIVDTDFSIEREALKLYGGAYKIVWVGDGSQISNAKLLRAYHALSGLDKDAETSIMDRFVLMYNRVSSRTGRSLTDLTMKTIGGANRIEQATPVQIIERLSKDNMFERLCEEEPYEI